MLSETGAGSLALLAGIVFGAAVVRGYSGFGFSALFVASVSLFWVPAEVVPLALMLEAAAGLHLLPLLWRDVDWRQFGFVLAGAAIALPLGVFLLDRLPADTMRLTISLAIFAIALVVLAGVKIESGQRGLFVFAGGLVSGFATGAAGIGGLPLVVLFLSNDTRVASMRATLTAYFVASNLYGLAVMAGEGLLQRAIFERFAWCLLPLALGVWLGNRGFERRGDHDYRMLATMLLILLAVIGVVRAIAMGQGAAVSLG